MNSRFYYPTNAGSLGETWWRRNFTTASVPPAVHLVAYSDQVKDIKRPTVLVVEDDENALFVLKTILRLKGYRVLQAWDGKQAMDIVKNEDLNLILLDLNLPSMGGLEVMRHLRANLDFECIPVVIMTGHEPEKYRGRAIDAGCDDFLLKPIDFDRLDAVLDYFVPLRIAA